MIHYNPTEERYDFRSYAHGMGSGDYPLTQLEENVFRWEIKNEYVYIRYTITHNEQDQWHEFGEVYVAQADQWYPMFEMTLNRVADAD
ncbi:MAG TPA: hypothetical protein DCR93_15560 [Cytophagales bacterium]|nr:hypothetical protein [Cytophagales bacterium]